MNRLTNSSGGNNDCKSELFFTHSDHLGSSSWTTDANGRAIQHIEYLPFGEEFVNQRTTSYSERYTFTGKELDAESNLYYYDARYNSSTYSQFTSIDPMSDKYPAVNPYLYCSGNPIMRIDPDGRADYYDENGKFMFDDGVNDKKIYQQNKLDVYTDNDVCYGDEERPFTYVGEVDNISLSYNGEMLTGKKSSGKLTVYQHVGNKKFERQSFDAVSGSSKGCYSLENGKYKCSNFRKRYESEQDGAYFNYGVGFSIVLTPLFNTRRDLLRIHPDGNKPGTQGCIGLTGKGYELRQFTNLVKSFVNGPTIVQLVVDIQNNPQCYYAGDKNHKPLFRKSKK